MEIMEVKSLDKEAFFTQDIGGKHVLSCRSIKGEPEIVDGRCMFIFLHL